MLSALPRRRAGVRAPRNEVVAQELGAQALGAQRSASEREADRTAISSGVRSSGQSHNATPGIAEASARGADAVVAICTYPPQMRYTALTGSVSAGQL